MNFKKDVWQIVVLCFAIHVKFSQAKSVSLNVTANGCNPCKLYGTPCPSIKVDGREYMNRNNGIDIVVIDTVNGNVTSRHFNPLENVQEDTKKVFTKYIEEINKHSVVIAISQGKCSLKRSWFHEISDFIHFEGEVSLNYAEIGVAIFCKGECPQAIEGKLPYSYFGSGAWHQVNTKFQLNDIESISKVQSISKLPLIIGVTAGLVCLLAASFVLIWKKRTKLRSSPSSKAPQCDESDATTANVIPVKPFEERLSVGMTTSDPSQLYQSLQRNHFPSEYSPLQVNTTKDTADDYDYLHEQAENEYYQTDLNETNNPTAFHEYSTLYPYVVSPGSSHQIFKKSMNIIKRDQSVREKEFASYITFEERFKENTVYKKPSNVPKFDAPIPMPKHFQRDSYLNMEESVYHNSFYQPLSGVDKVLNDYEVLCPEN